MAQQPISASSRRNASRGQTPQFRLLLVAIAGNTGNTVSITVLNAPSPLILNGIPAIRRESDGTLPSAATVTTNVLTLTYDSPTSANDTYDIAQSDSALRGRNGEYLAPAKIGPRPSPIRTNVNSATFDAGTSTISGTMTGTLTNLPQIDFQTADGASVLNFWQATPNAARDFTIDTSASPGYVPVILWAVQSDDPSIVETTGQATTL